MDQAKLLAYAVQKLEGLGIPYMVVGSFTSSAYGDPRFTQDIDIVVDLRADQVSALCEAFPAADFYVSREAARAAIEQRSQFNVIHPESGNKIDFMIARADPWGAEQLRRRQAIRFLPDLTAYVARPEDVILGKLLYYEEGGSEKHLRDITGILKAGTPVDRAYIEHWSQQLGVGHVWEAIQTRMSGG